MERHTTRYPAEVRELRQANEILRKASAYFSQAELDRRFCQIKRLVIGSGFNLRG